MASYHVNLIPNGIPVSYSKNLDSEEIVDQVRTQQRQHLIIVFAYTTICAVVGVAGNALVIYVYGYRWKMCQPTTIFIVFLAFLDITTCVFCLPTEMYILYNIVDFDYPLWCKLKTFVHYVLNLSTTQMMLVIAVDRWIKVSRPHSYFFNVRSARQVCLGTLGVSVFVNWPSLVIYGNLSIPILGTNWIGTTCTISDDYLHTQWPLYFYLSYTAVYMTVVVAFTALYVSLTSRLAQLKRRHEQIMHNKIAATKPGKGIGSSKAALALKRHWHRCCNRPKKVVPAMEDEEDEGEDSLRISSISSTTIFQELATTFEEGYPGIDELTQTALEGKSHDRWKRHSLSLSRSFTSQRSRRQSSGVSSLYGRAPKMSIVMSLFMEKEVASIRTAPDDGSQATTKEGTSVKVGVSMVGYDSLTVENDVTPLDSDEQGLANLAEHSSRETMAKSEKLDSKKDPTSSSEKSESKDNVLTSSESQAGKGAVHQPSNRKDYLNTRKRSIRYSDKVMAVKEEDEEEAAREQQAREQEAKKQESRKQEARKQEAREQEAKKQEAREQEAREQEAREQEAKENGGTTGQGDPETPAQPVLLLPTAASSAGETSASPLNEAALRDFKPVLVLPKAASSAGETSASPVNEAALRDFKPQRNSGRKKYRCAVCVRDVCCCLGKASGERNVYNPRRTTIMLCVIAVVCFLSFFPFLLIVIMRSVAGFDFFLRMSNTEAVVVNLFIRSAFISNIANPFIYGIMNRQFRIECVRLMGIL